MSEGPTGPEREIQARCLADTILQHSPAMRTRLARTRARLAEALQDSELQLAMCRRIEEGITHPSRQAQVRRRLQSQIRSAHKSEVAPYLEGMALRYEDARHVVGKEREDAQALAAQLQESFVALAPALLGPRYLLVEEALSQARERASLLERTESALARAGDAYRRCSQAWSRDPSAD